MPGADPFLYYKRPFLNKHFKCRSVQISEHLRPVCWVYLSYDYKDTSTGSAWRAESKLRHCREMFYPESSIFTVTGFILAGQIYA